MRTILTAVILLLQSFTLADGAEATAASPDTDITVVSTTKAPSSFGPYSQAIRAGGGGLNRVVKVTVFLSDWNTSRR